MLNSLTRWLILAAVGCFATSLLPSVAMAKIHIVIKFTYVTTEISPRQETHRSESTNHIDADGRIFSNPINKSLPQASFGDAVSGVNRSGTPFQASYRVINGRIVQTVRFSGSIAVFSVATNGRDSCSAQITYKKIPGQRYFSGTRITNGETMYLSDEHAENVTCDISSD